MNTSNLYYLMSLAAFIATLVYQGRREKRENLDTATATLLGTYQQTMTAQAERIALLEQDKKERDTLLKKQEDRIQYLEELLLGHGHDPKLVQPGSVHHVRGPGRGGGAANPAGGGD